jgi:hypothetical protein
MTTKIRGGFFAWLCVGLLLLASLTLIPARSAQAAGYPDHPAKLLSFGILPDGDSSTDFAAYVNDEIAKWKRVIEVGKINKI